MILEVEIPDCHDIGFRHETDLNSEALSYVEEEQSPGRFAGLRTLECGHNLLDETSHQVDWN